MLLINAVSVLLAVAVGTGSFWMFLQRLYYRGGLITPRRWTFVRYGFSSICFWALWFWSAYGGYIYGLDYRINLTLQLVFVGVSWVAARSNVLHLFTNKYNDLFASAFVGTSFLLATTLGAPYVGATIVGDWLIVMFIPRVLDGVNKGFRYLGIWKALGVNSWAAWLEYRMSQYFYSSDELKIVGATALVVYCKLRRAHTKMKKRIEKGKQYEGLFSSLNTEGFTLSSFFDLMAAAVKVGGITAALADFGLGMKSDSVYHTTLIGDLFRFIGFMCPKDVPVGNSVAERWDVSAFFFGYGDGASPMERAAGVPAEVAEPEEPLEWAAFFYAKWKEFTSLLHAHRGRLTAASIGVALGVAIFLYRYERKKVVDWLMGMKENVVSKTTSVTTSVKEVGADCVNEVRDTAQDLHDDIRSTISQLMRRQYEYETKGKNKSGRGALKHNSQRKANQIKYHRYVVYDTDQIVDVWVRDNRYVGDHEWERINKDSLSKSGIERGEYTIFRRLENGQIIQTYVLVDEDGVVSRDMNAEDRIEDFDDDEGHALHRREVFHKGKYDHRTNKFTQTFESIELDIPLTARPKVVEKGDKSKATTYESLVSAGNRTNVSKISQGIMGVYSEGVRVGYAIGTVQGIITNKHHKFDEFEFAGKKFAKTTLRAVKNLHEDLAVYNPVEGGPQLKKASFELPQVAQKVTLFNGVNTSNGEVLEVSEGEAIYTVSTDAGDCGSPVINVNGRIVAIHMRANEKDKNNAGIAVSERLLSLFDSPPPVIKN